MEVTLKFDRAILLDSTYDWATLQENEAVIGQVNGRLAITQYLSGEQWEDIKRQGKEEYLRRREREASRT
ncbi:hypothetical protein [Brevibacillus sp. FSL K6-2834]|uniref:hypothetical protein n=1 Tax=Brevibacillus sp. FSL K6-2834 TaxID=2954680 RepID=UPI003158C181